MTDNVAITPGSGSTIATDDVAGVQYQRVKVCFGIDGSATDASSASPLPVTISGAIAVSGTFYQTTQPISGAVAVSNLPATQPVSGTVTVGNASLAVTGAFYQATQPVSGTVTANAGTGTFAVSGPLTDTQLRASAVPVSGTFWQATQPVSGSVSVSNFPASQAVTGTFWQATQPVSIATMPSTPVTGTFWQATQPVSGTVAATQSGTWNVGTVTTITNAVTITPPTLTKGTQASTGLSVQDLKDAGRSCLAMTAEFSFAQTAETLLTMTLSVDGAATSTFSSRVITSGKKFRIQSVHIAVESLGSGTAPQRAYLRLRRNTAGATIASSPLQAVWGCINSVAIVKSGAVMDYEYPDGMEMNGDGTGTFGFTLETPDWVTSTATGRAKITVIGFEY